MFLQKIPLEILALVADNLVMDDVYNLSLCCRRFSSLLYDQGLCKRMLQVCSHVYNQEHGKGLVR
jgi:hypothetical protein